jgi:thymidine kinase
VYNGTYDELEKDRKAMAKLYYYYGAMGSSKTANALMTRFNYEEVGQKALLCKPRLDTRDGAATIRSRIGLEEECVFLEDLVKYSEEQIRQYNCIIVDEVQFASREQIDFLSDIVDFMDVAVVCYGLRADFQNQLFPGSERLIAIADYIQELKTVCWCGKKAICNARYNEKGIVREGAQVMLGSNDDYVALCRKHFKLGMLGPNFK